MAKGDLPVIVGVGQTVSQWDGKNGTVGAPSPLSLMVDASKTALADAKISSGAIDTIAVVRINQDSYQNAPRPLGHNANLPGTLARDLSASPETLIYSGAGGQTPQALVNELAARIFDGEFECALISGSEAIKTAKAAKKHGLNIDWTDNDDADFEDRGFGSVMLNRTEIKHGMVLPAIFYGIFENAIAAREGRTRSEQRAAMAKLFAPFSKVAANNPYSQFPVAHDETFLATPSPKNYEFVDPFLKWFIAQDAVNLGAAVVVMSSSKADELGIAEGQRVYLHGAGEAADDFISARPVLDRSWAMETAVARAFDQAELTLDDIDHFDLYSCFPCAVFSGCAALGIDWESESRPLTQTGGLPYFGGPGNNYSLHGIAEIVQKARTGAGRFGLVLANGGWMTKEAVGIYSTKKPVSFTPVAEAAKPTEQVDIVQEDGQVIVESFTVVHGKDGPRQGIVFTRRENGRRTLANATPDALTDLLNETTSIRRKGRVVVDDITGTFTFD